ncbi:PucR family transcriptional regulator [Jatrophihabitans sp. YIM 134969]
MSRGESVESVLERLGPLLFRHEAGPAGADQVFDHVEIFDSHNTIPAPPRGLVLGVGIRGATEIENVLERMLRSRATVLVVREPVELDVASRQRLDDSGVTLLSLVRGAPWLHVANLLQPPTLAGEDRWTVMGAAEAEVDLFALSNQLSSLLDAPVTIEDLQSRILAFSADQGRGDAARQASVLGQQVPGDHQARLTELGIFARIYASARPVQVAPYTADVLPRVAVRVAIGDEILGSIWIISDTAPTPLQEQAITDTATTAAIAMTRNRVGADAVSRMRSATVAALLEGGQAAGEAASRLRSSVRPVRGGHVVAVGLPRDATARPARLSAANLDHVASSLTLLLRSELPDTVGAVFGDTIYTVVLTHGGGDDVTPQIRRLVDAFVNRLGADWSQIAVAIGSPVDRISDLHRSRESADRTLRALHARPRTRRTGHEVASPADVYTESLLLRLSDLVDADMDARDDPLAVLTAYDLEHGASLVATLRTWLDQFGDVASTADHLHVHKNTLRYRLSRIEELLDDDLKDANTRFELMLRLRLGADR